MRSAFCRSVSRGCPRFLSRPAGHACVVRSPPRHHCLSRRWNRATFCTRRPDAASAETKARATVKEADKAEGSPTDTARAAYTKAALRRARIADVFGQYARGENKETAALGAEELRHLLRRAAPHARISDAQIQGMINVADANRSGTVDLDEFVRLFEDIPDDRLSVVHFAEYWTRSANVQNADVIFNSVWRSVKQRVPLERFCFPSEILFLGGAPGSGKGTNTRFIMQQRGMTSKAIVMSDLLQSPAAQKAKAIGGLVSDSEVLAMLMEELVRPQYRSGALIDGFPRTQVQVDCVRLLREKMQKLHVEFDGTELATQFPPPRFRIAVLYVSEQESIRRQLGRGNQIIEHNRRVRETGEGELLPLRETDTSPKAARIRYTAFREQTFDSLMMLKETFPFNMIDASAELDKVQTILQEEFSYQSSLELLPETYSVIKGIPNAENITTHARQQLVSRLDSYQMSNPKLFAQVADLISRRIVPSLKLAALSGWAMIRLDDEELLKQHQCLEMVIDILADRSYRSTVDVTTMTFHVRFTRGSA